MSLDLLPNPAHGFHAEPCSARCQRIWQHGDHALIGVSTGNSYFTQERLAALLTWAGHFFTDVDVLYVDTHIDTMLVALGHSAQHATKLAKSRIRDVRRRIRRALEQIRPGGDRFRVHALSDFLAEPTYQRLRVHVDQALASDHRFASVCEDMVRRFLLARPDPDGDAPKTLRAGLNYLLAELPFFVDSPAIFGVSSSANCYHVSTPLVEYLVRYQDGVLRAARNQGFMVVRPAEDYPHP
ncbi:tRNA-dependent cyclodipeptide synthase [Goodfellowiella coeruleoviolacea]|uniref:Cyclodipeptide synthase n=1 Tax=Goodfellowiella coeruleoviolacea TaxID=334858 RepID=A0AAE3KN02_9PSEU|nr:tRNA-dependent cyclodipeptide synthase [Goodfellowiella coeruleoviolacea]MCP2168188.1 cyclo(L-tyrosyl-L-tyrosyl) synthase [Goodfellowiella coeruleoviolacea]